MTVTLRAAAQYGDYTGTTSLDEGDFENLAKLLGLDDWFICGASYYFSHPPLGIGGSASESGGSLTVWAFEWSRLMNGDRDLPTVLREDGHVEVTEFSVDMADVEYPEPSNAMALLLRSSKRLNIVVWHRTFVDHGLDEEVFYVREKKRLLWRDGDYGLDED